MGARPAPCERSFSSEKNSIFIIFDLMEKAGDSDLPEAILPELGRVMANPEGRWRCFYHGRLDQPTVEEKCPVEQSASTGRNRRKMV